MHISLVKISKKQSEDNLISDVLYKGTFLGKIINGKPMLGEPIFFETSPDVLHMTETICRIKNNYLYSLNAKYTWNLEIQ